MQAPKTPAALELGLPTRLKFMIVRGLWACLVFPLKGLYLFGQVFGLRMGDQLQTAAPFSRTAPKAWAAWTRRNAGL